MIKKTVGNVVLKKFRDSFQFYDVQVLSAQRNETETKQIQNLFQNGVTTVL